MECCILYLIVRCAGVGLLFGLHMAPLDGLPIGAANIAGSLCATLYACVPLPFVRFILSCALYRLFLFSVLCLVFLVL
jgi:hypothetical protein